MKKNIIITGAAGNLGEALVKSLVKKNAKVICFDNNKKNLSNLKKKYNKIDAYFCDLTDEKNLISVFNKIFKKYKKIDLLINNAGYISNSLIVSLGEKGLSRHSYDLWKKTISNNLDSTFLVSSFIIENMISNRNEGLIINISSISANGNVGQSAYSAAKSGVNALTKTWSKELSKFKIRVAGISPGFIETISTKKAVSKKIIDKLKENTPSRRLGKKLEFIQAINFIINNKFFNGKILEIDGGLNI